jgi:uncharacterized membrane protein
LWLVFFFSVVAWFLGPNIVESREEKLLAYVVHIGGGALALATAPFQFIAPIRNRYRRYHRIAGYTYVGGTVAAVIGFLFLLPLETDLFLLSNIVALSIWLGCALVAVAAIRRKHVLTHQHNMARSFVVGAYFLIVRVIDQHLMWVLEPLSKVEAARLAHSDWLAWVLPLIAVEIWFGMKWDRLLRRREKGLPLQS